MLGEVGKMYWMYIPKIVFREKNKKLRNVKVNFKVKNKKNSKMSVKKIYEDCGL